MPQNEHIELHTKRCGRKFDHEKRQKKLLARNHRIVSKKAKKLRGMKAKLFNRKRYVEKIQTTKKIRAHEKKETITPAEGIMPGSVPSYLLDRKGANRTKILSNMIKEKKKEKAGVWSVPIQSVSGMSQNDMLGVVRSGKRKRKNWKRIVRTVTYVPSSYTRKPPAFEKHIRPTALRMRSANVYHPQLSVTSKLKIIGVKHNPQSKLFTSLGCITKGTIVEVDVSGLGMITPGGNIVWGKYCQVTNNPDLDGCINATLLV